MVEVHHEIEVRCPPELDNVPAQAPQPSADAVVQYNAEGRDYIAALIAYASSLVDQLSDARLACPAQPPGGG